MIKNWHTGVALILVLVFGSGLFYIGTDGFRALTAETVRINQLMKDQPIFPNVTFEDSNNRTYSISEFEGKHVFITFFYTSCTTVCLQLEMNMAQVYELVPSKYMEKDIIFLSISFDPMRDDPAALDKYKDYFNSDGETWRMARIPDQAELDSLLQTFGVTVITGENGHFAHNAAFYLINKNGSLIDVMNYTKVDEVASRIVSILEKEEGE